MLAANLGEMFSAETGNEFQVLRIQVRVAACQDDESAKCLAENLSIQDGIAASRILHEYF